MIDFNPLTVAAVVVDDLKKIIKHTIFKLSAIYSNQMTSKGQLFPVNKLKIAINSGC